MSESSSEEQPVTVRVPISKKPRNSKGITPIIKKAPFPEPIKKRAIEIYNTLDVENHKSDKKKRLACYCIQQAYSDKGEPEISVIEIGKRLGISPAESRNAVSTRPIYKKGFRASECNVTADKIIFTYVTETYNLSEERANEIVEDFNMLLATDPELKTKQTKTVIAAYLMYWMPMNCLEIDEKKLATDFGLVQGTVKSMCNEIKKSAVKTA